MRRFAGPQVFFVLIGVSGLVWNVPRLLDIGLTPRAILPVIVIVFDVVFIYSAFRFRDLVVRWPAGLINLCYGYLAFMALSLIIRAVEVYLGGRTEQASSILIGGCISVAFWWLLTRLIAGSIRYHSGLTTASSRQYAA